MSYEHHQQPEVDPYIEANRAHFDKDAHKYDDRPIALKLARKVGEVVMTKYEFDEDETVLLDYACGTGLVSQALAPSCKKIVGVDISQGMVDWYNTRVANQGLDPEEMKAVCVELKGEQQPDELDGVKFDVVICSMAYHHFRSIEEVTKILAFHLKPGGRLIVIDIIFDPSRKDFFSGGHSDGHGHHHHGHDHAHEHEHTDHSHEPEQTPAENDNSEETDPNHFPVPPTNVVAHKGGFTRERIEGVFDGAGLGDFDWSIVGDFEPLRGKTTVQLFCAIGTTATGGRSDDGATQ